jgi:hypothetical protein
VFRKSSLAALLPALWEKPYGYVALTVSRRCDNFKHLYDVARRAYSTWMPTLW